MQETKAYLELLHERGRKGLPVERVYRQLFNRHLYLSAYGKIYRNAGAMTPGVTEETVDGMSLEKIDTIIEALRYERYRWTPVKRMYIPKKNGKLRPLGLPTWSDKLVQEVLRMILEAYYEPQFSDHSHGFRPGRGCHTALREIYYNWRGTAWFIEGDISACFDRLDHESLLQALQERMHDGRIVQLLKQMLDAGYLEGWKLHTTLSGTPQGGVISPILANILLDKLDKYVEKTLIPKYTRGEQRGENPVYRRIKRQYANARSQGGKAEAATWRRLLQQTPSKDTLDPGFRRLRYVRYADDFLLGFCGPKEEAEEIKREIAQFLQEELKLELSDTKTLITHARSEKARFLGYEISAHLNDAKRVKERRNGRIVNRRAINGGIVLGIPESVKQEYSQRYMKDGKPIHRTELLGRSVYDIILHYQMEYRGIVNYYRLAQNLHTLKRLKWVMEMSLTKTLARKLKLSVKQVYAKYGVTDIVVQSKAYKGLRTVVPREGKAPLVATWGGIPLAWDIQATIEDNPKRLYAGKSELERRLLANACELCQAQEHLEVHHIRKLSDLHRYTGREKPAWVQFMMTRKRKTMVLCRMCHQDVTHGRPLRRKRSSS